MKKAKHKQSSEKKQETVHANKSNKSTCCGRSSWMIASIVLAVLLIASIIMLFVGNTGSMNTLSEDAAEEKAAEFVEVISNPEIPLTVQSVEKVDNLYEITAESQGQIQVFFMSLDGEYLFPSAFTLDELVELIGNQQPSAPSQPAGEVEVNLEGANTLGSGDLVMVEYASATCGFCKRYADETFPLIEAEYIDDGDLTYVYKHYTRSNTDVVAANAMECAGEQDAFFTYKDLVYANPQLLSQEESFVTWAETLELDVDEFSTCFDERRYTEKIAADTAEGRSNGVTGTPGFLIDSELIAGAQPFASFKAVIDAQLEN